MIVFPVTLLIRKQESATREAILMRAIWAKSFTCACKKMAWVFRCSMPSTTPSRLICLLNSFWPSIAPPHQSPAKWTNLKVRFQTAKFAKCWASKNNTTGGNTSEEIKLPASIACLNNRHRFWSSLRSGLGRSGSHR